MTFHRRLAEGEALLGTFVKTAHHAIVEVLGGTGLDYAILDAEHAVFSPPEIDRCILAARAVGLPVLVRLTEGRAPDILRVLDMGADGFLVPHVTSASQAEAIVRASHYGAGGRGYSATNRAGGYGTVPMAQHMENARSVAVVVQIEDPEGVEAIEEIASVPGIASCFVGRADLAVAYGAATLDDPAVDAAVERVLAACRASGVPVSTFVPDMAAAGPWFAKGVRMIAVASEHKPMQGFFSSDAVEAAKGEEGA